jgi:hypothetical protein
VSDVGVDGLVKPHQQTKINLKSTNHQGAWLLQRGLLSSEHP